MSSPALSTPEPGSVPSTLRSVPATVEALQAALARVPAWGWGWYPCTRGERCGW